MGLFKIGEISRKLIYPILMSLANMFTIVSTILLNKQYNDKEGKVTIEFGKHPFVIDFIMFAAEGCAIFIFFIQQKIMNNSNFSDISVSTLTKSQIGYKKEEQKRKSIKFLPDSKRIKILLLIFLTFALDLIASTALFMTRQIDNVSSMELFFKIVCLIVSTFLSICLLNYKYYKHHFIGCVFLTIGLASYSAIDFIQNLSKMDPHDILSSDTVVIISFVFLASYVLTSLQEVLHKYLMDLMFVSPFVIISLEGIFGVVFMSVSFYKFYHQDCTSKLICTPGNKVENIFETFNNVTSHYQLFIPIIIMFFSFMAFNCFRLLTNQAYSPTHRIIPDVFGCFFSWLIRVIFPSLDDIEFMSLHNVVIGFSFFIMMIGALIYLEIIELHFCGLSQNIRRTIATRQDIDLKINYNIKGDIYPLLDQSVE